MKSFPRHTLRAALFVLLTANAAHALDYSFVLDGTPTPLNAVERSGRVYVEANKFGKYLGPILDRVIDVNAIVGGITSRVDAGPLNGLLGGLVNRAVQNTKYEVIRLAEEPYVELEAFARGQGARLVYHPFDKTFVIARDEAGLARGEDARFARLETARVRLDEAALQQGALRLRLATLADEATAQRWTFVGDGRVLTVRDVTPADGGWNVTLDLRDGAIPAALAVHAGGDRVTYDLSSLR